VISLHLARWLRDAGLDWHPVQGDEFMIPEHGIDDRVFRISDMVVEVRRIHSGTMIALNGTTEWALDSVMLGDALWLPREDQLRALLDDDFVRLERHPDRWSVTLTDTPPVSATTAADALATALLTHLDAELDGPPRTSGASP